MATPCRAQSDANLSGYLEHQYAVDRLGSRWQHLDYDRLRIDLDAEAGRRTHASASLVFQLYRGTTTLDQADYVPASLGLSRDSLIVVLSDGHYVNHAFVRLKAGRLLLTVGKQYLTWGAGWVFNPTELFRPKNLYEPSYDREGVGALSGRIALAGLSDLTLAFVPERTFGRSGRVVRLRHHLHGVDVSALAAAYYEDVSSYHRRTTLGADASGEVGPVGAWIEAAYSDAAGQRWWDVVAGGNHTLGNGSLVVLEILRNGRGYTSAPYPAGAWLERLTGIRRTLGRWTVFASLSHEAGQLWRAGVSVIAGPVDASGVLIPSVAYAFAENVDLLLNGLIFIGEEEDEFGSGRLGAFARARVYF